MRIEEMEKQGVLSLQALLAAVDQVEPERQVPLLRNGIDLALDRVATAEDAYYEFLSDCVFLAAQNMQDVRLHDIERRLERLENPEAPGITTVLIETAIILAVELGVTFGAPWVAGPVLMYVSTRWLSQSTRASARGAQFFETSARARSNKLASEVAHARSDLAIAEARYLSLARVPIEKLSSSEFITQRTQARIAYRRAQEAYELFGLEIARNGAVLADNMARAFADTLARRAPRLRSQALKKFLEGATFHTIRSRLGESAGQQLAKLLQTAYANLTHVDTTPSHAPFLSSTVVGEILTQLRELRTESSRGHSYTRQLLRAIPDASFTSSALAQEVARGLLDAVAPIEGALALADVVRPVVVRGFEALLWYEWMTITGALTIETGRELSASWKLQPGDLHNGHIVSKVISESDLEPGEFTGIGATGASNRTIHLYEGDLYHGVRKLSDPQTRYLYDTFAAPYFALPENASLLPFRNAYDPKRYLDVLNLAPANLHGAANNSERDSRLDEMRIMVVIFFLNFLPAHRGKASYGAITDIPVLVDDYLSQLPEHQPSAPSDDICETSPETVAAELNALFGQAGVEERRDASLGIVQFESQLNSLELRVWMYDLVHSQTSYESAEGPDGKTADEARREIVELQDLVNASYPPLFEFLIAAQPEAAAVFRKRYEVRVNDLNSRIDRLPTAAKPRFSSEQR